MMKLLTGAPPFIHRARIIILPRFQLFLQKSNPNYVARKFHYISIVTSLPFVCSHHRGLCSRPTFSYPKGLILINPWTWFVSRSGPEIPWNDNMLPRQKEKVAERRQWCYIVDKGVKQRKNHPLLAIDFDRQ